MLTMSDVVAKIEDKEILNGFSLKVSRGQVHAIMGPNGAGKSTLAKVLAGHPLYEVSAGSVHFKDEDLLEMEPHERCLAGLFMSFQYPPEIEGLNMRTFLRSILDAKSRHEQKQVLSDEEFEETVFSAMDALDMPRSFLDRNLNEGFSGGEKKRAEILQMALLKPELSVLDETDSGLDIDALRQVAGGVEKLRSKETSVILITHYQRLLDYVKPDFVHVMAQGRIVKSGGPELALELEKHGYDWVQSGEPLPASH